MIRLFKVFIPGNLLALILSETLLIFGSYILAAYWLLDIPLDIYLIDDYGLGRIALVVGVIVLGLYLHDLYENYRVRSASLLMQQMCVVLGGAFVFEALLGYARSTALLPKWLMVYGSATVLIVVPAWRMLFSRVIYKALGSKRLLFLGISPEVRRIAERIAEQPELGFSAVGYLDPDHNVSEDPPGLARLGSANDLDSVISAYRPDQIVVGMAERRQLLPVDRLLQLRFSGLSIEDAAATYETVFSRVSTRDLRPSQLIFSSELGPRPHSVSLQSLYSLVLGIAGIIVLSPVMAIVALLIALTSRGPVLYRQTRVGLNGVPFTLYKFRSMYQDSEATTGAVLAVKGDPRITPLGRWLRKLRLDELPQLFNVVRGEMVIVGPRPERPEFVQVFQEKIPFYNQRHCVKPGITGWAQINHGYGDTFQDTIVKLEYDLYYIKHLAVSLDAYIIFHTLKTMLLGKGAQ